MTEEQLKECFVEVEVLTYELESKWYDMQNKIDTLESTVYDLKWSIERLEDKFSDLEYSGRI